MQFKFRSSSKLSDPSRSTLLAFLLLVSLLLLLLPPPTSQQIFGDDEDDQDDDKMSSTTTPPSLTDLIKLDKSKLDWTCNDDKNRALIHFNFFNLTTTHHAQQHQQPIDDSNSDNDTDIDESFNIFYKYMSCHPANCKFIYLTSLNTTKVNATVRVLLDNYYKYEFRFTYQRTAKRQRRSVDIIDTTTPVTETARPVNVETGVLVCPSSTVSSPIKFGVCDQYEFNIHALDDCSLILVKATPSGFVKYIYLFIVVVVVFVIFINLIKKIKFKYQIIKS